MVSETKFRRQVAAAEAKIERRLKRVMSLSLGLIRTQIAFHQYDRARDAYLNSGVSDEDAISDSLERLHRLEPSEFTRLDANLTFFSRLCTRSFITGASGIFRTMP